MNSIKETNLMDEMKKACNMQIKFWNDLRKTLDSIDNSDERTMCMTWRNHFVKNTESSLQVVLVRLLIEAKTKNEEG